MRNATLVLFAAAVVSLAGRVAHAQEEPEALIRQGVELRRRGNDALAQGYFKRAYSIAHTPRSAAQLGLVEQALGHFLDAEQHLSEALDNASDDWVDQNRSTLKKSRELVRGHLAPVQVRGLPAGATVAIGNRPAGAVATDGTIWVAPGSTSLTFDAPGHEPVVKEIVATAGTPVAVDVELAPKAAGLPAALPEPAPQPTAAPPTIQAQADLHSDTSDVGRSRRVAGTIVAGAGAALAVAGVVTYLVGSSRLDAINHDAGAHMPYNPSNGDYQTLGDLGIGLMVAGGAAVATGAVLYFFNRAPTREASSASVSVGYLPGGGARLQIGGRF
jgi:hypothetical protein